MKNKKGFILSTYVYILLVFFLLLLGTMLAVLNNTRILSNKLKDQSSNTSGLINKDFSFVLLGDKETIIRKGEEYIDPGYKIQSSGGNDLSDIVKVTGSVNSDTIGMYELTYTATYNGITKTISRNVEVVGTAVEKIERLATESNTEGLITDDTVDHNIRYAGGSPKNYIKFNDENWRIIGIFNVTTVDETTGEEKPGKLMKIVKDTSIGEYSWDSSASSINGGYGVNEWSQADLMTELNTLYLNQESGICYNEEDNASTACDFGTTGISNTYRSMIEEIVWNTGAITDASSIERSSAYSQERGTSTGKDLCTSGTYCNDTVTRTITWTGKVGLIYPSDYGYASTSGTDIGNSAIGTTNWLKSGSSYWTISPSADSGNSNNVWPVHSGVVDDTGAFNGIGVKPSVYLKSNVYIMGGNGNSTNPYRISM